MVKIIAYFSLFVATGVSLISSPGWPHWRGPNFNGSATGSLEYPIHFSKKKNVKWVYRTPGPSASTPVVHNDLIYLSSIDQEGGGDPTESRLLAICLNRMTGKVVWFDRVGSGYRPGDNHGLEHQLDSKSNYASPSPSVGKKEVVFFFGNGDLVCYEKDGSRRWSRNIQEDYGDFCFQWTFSASPTILGDSVYIPILQRDEQVHGRGKENADSFILKIGLADGRTIWKKIRFSNARKESRESFASIIPYKNQLLVAGGDVLTAHSIEDGEELWRWGTWNTGHKQEWWRLVPSPVLGDGKVMVCAPKGQPVYAIDVTDNSPKLSWTSVGNRFLTSDVPTPLFHQGYFYILSDLKKCLAKVDPQNGEVLWQIMLPGNYKWRSSPSGAGGMIYIMNHNAHVLVVSTQDGSILNSAKMGDDYDDLTRSSIVLVEGVAYIRTNKILYCIEE